MDSQIIVEGGKFIHLLPQADGPLFCPLCPSRKYTGVTRVDGANRHIREQHPDNVISFRCRLCGFDPPADKRYPRKIVTTHCASEHPDVPVERTGAADTARRRALRDRIAPVPVAPRRPANAAVAVAIPRAPQVAEQVANRGPTSPNQAERDRVVSPGLPSGERTPPQHHHAAADSDDDVFFTPVVRRRRRTGRNVVRSSTTSSSSATSGQAPSQQDQLAAPPSPRPPGTPAQNTSEGGEAGPLSPTYAEVVRRSLTLSPSPSSSPPSPPPPQSPPGVHPRVEDNSSQPATPTASPPGNRGRQAGEGSPPVGLRPEEAASNTTRPRTARPRRIRDIVRGLTEDLNAVQSPELLEEITPRVMEFLGRLAERPLRVQARRPGQQRPRRAQPQTDRVGEARRIQHLYRNNKKRAVQRVLEDQQPVCETPLALVHEHFARMAAPTDGEPDWPPVLDQGEADAVSNSRLRRLHEGRGIPSSPGS